MKRERLLLASSLACLLLTTFHLADDMVYGWEPGTWTNLWAFPIFAVWLYGTTVLSRRVSGYIVMLLGSMMSIGIPMIHMSGRGIGTASRVAGQAGHHFFVWTLIMLACLGLFSFVLSIEGILRRDWRRAAPID
jgi:hypothetical protein